MSLDTANWSGAVVDLTLLLAEELPCAWPAHMPYQQKTFNYFDERGEDEAHLTSPCGSYQTRWLLMDEHTGTHVDAPAHFIPREETGLDAAGPLGVITADRIDLTQLMGPAVVIDVDFLIQDEVPAGESPAIEKTHILAFEREHGELRRGDIVLFRSRWDEGRYQTGMTGRAYVYNAVILHQGPGWPAPSAEAMEYLLERGIRCVGTDGPSMGSSHAGRDVHLAGLGNGAVFIEALGNLGSLPIRGAHFVFAPLKVARGSGAPGRAFAILPA